MVVDRIENANLYYGLGERIEAGLKYLENTDFTDKPPGKYSIDGENVYAVVQQYETRLPEECKWEAHRKFIDIQYVVQGAENMGYASLDNLYVTQEYDEINDYLLLEGKGSMVLCKSGTFTVFMPEDAHMPGVAIGSPKQVKKAVVKVRID